MRLAILSDIHGNPMALDAVLRDIAEHGGVDGYLVLGDLVAQGFDPAGALERLAALPNAHFVRGNTDRYTLTDARPGPTIEQAQGDPDLVPLVVMVAQSFAWTHGALAATGWLDWLAALPLEQRLTLPDGTRLLAVHASPERDDGRGVEPDADDEELRCRFQGCHADLVCVGHTHRPLERHIPGVHIVNVGSVSNPPRDTSDRRPSYAMLEANEDSYRITLHRAPLDPDAVIRAIEHSHVFTDRDWLISFYRSGVSANSG